MEGIGLGLASLAFWGFVAAVSVAGIWSEIRNKDAQHETMRRIVDATSSNEHPSRSWSARSRVTSPCIAAHIACAISSGSPSRCPAATASWKGRAQARHARACAARVSGDT